MIRFRTLDVEGFGVFADPVSLDLEDRGLTLITGENEDTRAASSNGAGKSTVFKAISWALFGVTIDGLKTDVVALSKDSASVRLSLRVGAHEYAITRSATRSKRSLKLEALDEDGNWIDKSQGIRETDAAIVELLGLDWDAFRCVALFGQGDASRFASPSMTDTARKSILKQVLGLARYDRARDEARDARAALEAKLTKFERSLNSKETERAKTESMIELRERDIEEAEEFADNVEDEHKETLELIEEVRDELEEVYDEEVEAEKDRDSAREEVEEVEALLEKAKAGATRASYAEREARKALESVAKDACPTCKRPFDIDEDERARLEDEFEDAQTTYQRAKEVRDAFTEEHIAAKRIAASAEKFLSRLAAQNAACSARLEDLSEQAEKILKRGSEAHERAERLREEQEELREQAADLTSEIKVLNTKIERVTSEASVYDWWVKGFGPKGVQAYAIEQALPALNAATNRHLLALADGDLFVCWSATREGKSGTEIEELLCSVTVEGMKDVPPSGGQWKKIELATEIALAEVVRESGGAKSNLLMLDEALDGLDAEGVSRVCGWLEGLDYDSIFVISHADAITDRFEKTITVRKEDGISTIEG